MKGYRHGTHRAVSPETTFARIRPLWQHFGITRLADVTGLDSLGIPTYCAIRPGAIIVQVGNGKGLRHVDAQVSALMEAIEVATSEESPAAAIEVATPDELTAAGRRFSLDVPVRIRGARPILGRIEWVHGEDLVSHEQLLLPAAVAWLRPRQIIVYNSNGLASGNNLQEATLHALYEVLERHILSGLLERSTPDFSSAQVFDASQAGEETVRELHARIEAAGTKLVLLRVPSGLAVHAFMAVLLDRAPLAPVSTVNVGYGAHLSPAVAATRAITEAAQCRLTLIHGSRDDLSLAHYQQQDVHGRVRTFFDRLEPNAGWELLHDPATDTLETDLQTVLATIRENHMGQVFRVDMSQPGMPFSVVKVWIPSARHSLVS